MARLPAGVRKRADGVLEKRFTVDGKRYSVYGSTYKELTEKELELRKKIDSHIYTNNRNITLDGYFEEWIVQKKNTTKGNTLYSYRSYYERHISPVLGRRKVQQIERREIIILQGMLADNGLEISSVNHAVKILKAILNDAVVDEIIDRSPATGVRALKDETPKATETYHRALTVEEQKLFMDEAKSEFHYELIAFLLCSGMRIGEATALSWKDIDYKKGVIHITKTITLDEDGNMIIGESPKTSSGRRDIPLTDTLKAILKRQKYKLQNIFRIDEQIFVAVYGGLIRNNAVNRAISDTLKRLEEQGHHIEHFTAHALRDTYATRYIEQNGNPQTLKALLGHTSLKMTMDLYSHVMEDTKRKEAETIQFDIAL